MTLTLETVIRMETLPCLRDGDTQQLCVKLSVT